MQAIANPSAAAWFGAASPFHTRSVFHCDLCKESCSYIQSAEKSPQTDQCKQQTLYFFPLPQGQGALRPILGDVRWEVDAVA